MKLPPWPPLAVVLDAPDPAEPIVAGALERSTPDGRPVLPEDGRLRDDGPPPGVTDGTDVNDGDGPALDVGVPSPSTTAAAGFV
jgi:hypothetical protein